MRLPQFGDLMPEIEEGMPSRLLTYDDVAEITGITAGTLRYLRHKGRGPVGFKLGRQVRFLRRDVQAWIEQSRNAA
jgi:excisionase family DNA binding protein